MFHFLSKFDMISPRYELKFKGNDGYKTPLGSLFTVIVFATSFFSIRDMFFNFVNRRNPLMSMQNFSVDETSTVTASSIPVKISFVVAGEDKNKVSLINFPAPVITYVKPVTQNEASVNTSNLTAVNSTTSLSTVKSQMINCTYINGSLDSSHFCLDTEEQITFDYSKLSFDPTKVSQSNVTYVMIIEYTELRYNISNYDTPYFFGSNKEFIFAESNKYSLRELLFTKKTIDIQNTGFIYYSQRQTIDYYQLEEIKLIFSFDNANSTGIKKVTHDLRFTIKTTGDSITINYLTFDDLLSAFGGTFGSIFYIVHIIYSNICEFFMNTDLINVIFKFHTSILGPDPIIYKSVLTSDNNLQDQNIENSKKHLKQSKTLKMELATCSTKFSGYDDHYYLQRKLFEKEFEIYKSKKNLVHSNSEDNLLQTKSNESIDELDKQLKNLVLMLEDVGKNREPYYFNCCQYFRAKCKKGLKFCNLKLEEKVLLAAESVIETKMSYEFLAKTLNELQSIKHCIFDKELQCFVAMPSLNISSITSINKLNKFLLNSLDGNDQEVPFQRVLQIFSASELWRKRKTQRLFKNFSKSMF